MAAAKKAATKKATKATTVKKTAVKKAPVKKAPVKKTAVKKAPVKKTTVKSTTVKKTTVKKVAAANVSSTVKKTYKDALTKTEILNTIAESNEMTRKQVSGVLDTLSEIIAGHLNKRSAGFVTVPGLLKIEVKIKPARKSRKGINPFTGEETTFKAKPASRAVKIKALKKLKEMAG